MKSSLIFFIVILVGCGDNIDNSITSISCNLEVQQIVTQEISPERLAELQSEGEQVEIIGDNTNDSDEITFIVEFCQDIATSTETNTSSDNDVSNETQIETGDGTTTL